MNQITLDTTAIAIAVPSVTMAASWNRRRWAQSESSRNKIKQQRHEEQRIQELIKSGVKFGSSADIRLAR
ncbi:MAG: hypothetical protein WA231_10110 [Methylocella sp.]